MRKLICMLFVLIVVIFFVKLSIAAEHPGEHPGKPAKQEHPGDKPQSPKAMLSAKEIINGIESHINEVTKANAGYFPISFLSLSSSSIDVKRDSSIHIKLYHYKRRFSIV